MRRGNIFAIAVAAFGLYLFWVVGASPLRHSIQWEVASGVTQTLDRAGMPGIDVLVDGRDVQLRGTVTSQSLRTYAEQLASGTPGVRSVANMIEVAP